MRCALVYLHRSWFRQGFAGDSSIHFSIIKQLKKDPRSRYVEQYVIDDEPMSYPLVFHRIASAFPLRAVAKHPYAPNLLIFTVFSAAFFVYLHYVERHLLARSDFSYLMIGSVFYLFSTSNLVFDGPGIAYIKLSERLLARVTCAFYFLCLVVGTAWNDVVSLTLSVPLGALALTASIFARQAMLFTTPLLSALLWSPVPLGLLAASFLLALACSRDHLVRGMKHTILQWKLYKTLTKPHRWVRSMLSSFVSLRELQAAGRLRRAVWVLLNREPVRLFAFFPEIVLLVVLAFLAPIGGEVRYALLAPIVASLAVYLVTSTEAFNHLGESYRYVEYNLYFLAPAVLGVVCLAAPPAAVALGGAAYAVQVAVMWFVFQFLVLPRLRAYPAKDELGQFLSKAGIPGDAVVFPVSIATGADICARTDCRSFWYQPGVISTGLYENYFEEFPFLKKDYRGLFRKHGVTHVVCSKKTLQIMDWTYDFSGLRLICEDDAYVAYAVAGTIEDR